MFLIFLILGLKFIIESSQLNKILTYKCLYIILICNI